MIPKLTNSNSDKTSESLNEKKRKSLSKHYGNCVGETLYFDVHLWSVFLMCSHCKELTSQTIVCFSFLFFIIIIILDFYRDNKSFVCVLKHQITVISEVIELFSICKRKRRQMYCFMENLMWERTFMALRMCQHLLWSFMNDS